MTAGGLLLCRGIGFTVLVTGGLLMIIIGIQAGRTGAVVDLTIGGGHGITCRPKLC